jgi:hypothetical protein
MTHPTYNNKRIIWESKTRQVLVVIVSFLFVAAAIWTKNEYSSFVFWSTIIFFGGCGLFMLIRFINPNNLFVTHDTALGKKILADQFQKSQEDLGFFAYTDTGFNLREHTGVRHYNWAEIVTIFGFKEDRYTTDEICMDIFFNDKANIRLTESTPGWYQFNKRLNNAIPTVLENWDTEIMQPPFVTNMTLLFDKDNRGKEQAERACYGF